MNEKNTSLFMPMFMIAVPILFVVITAYFTEEILTQINVGIIIFLLLIILYRLHTIYKLLKEKKK